MIKKEEVSGIDSVMTNEDDSNRCFTNNDNGSVDLPPNPDDTFTILVATDIHLGYAEKDEVRFEDSVRTFEEVLQIAVERDVDFVLLGGDLFHDNKPSRYVMNSCVSLIRKYCMGDKPITFQFSSDPSINFAHSRNFPLVNYEDPNLNVGLPVFSIHGNHDDLSGNPSLCAMDILHNAGVLNFWGKYATDVEKIEVSPIILKKGETTLALYGLGSIKDDRLYRMFESKEISFLRPQNQNKCFNMFVVHQNRVKYGEKCYLPETFIPDYFHLVIWGHEHPSLIKPEYIGTPDGKNDLYISQPGSTIATSLSEGESGPKNVGLVQVNGEKFLLEPIRLQTVRQFYFEHIVLSETDIKPDKAYSKSEVEAYCVAKVMDLLDKAKEERGPKQPELPLIRLRIDYSGGYEIFNTQRFGQKFRGMVANPREMILFSRGREAGMKDSVNVDADAIAELVHKNKEDLDARVEDLVKEYFENADNDQKLVLLSEIGLGGSVREFVDKDEKDAVKGVVKHQVDKIQDRFKGTPLDSFHVDDITERLRRFKASRRVRDLTGIISKNENSGSSAIEGDENGEECDDYEDEEEEVERALKGIAQRRRDNSENLGDMLNSEPEDVEMDDRDFEESKPTPTRGRGRGRGRGSRSRGGRGTTSKGGASRGAKAGTSRRNDHSPLQSRNVAGPSSRDLQQSSLDDFHSSRTRPAANKRFVQNSVPSGSSEEEMEESVNSPFASPGPSSARRSALAKKAKIRD